MYLSCYGIRPINPQDIPEKLLAKLNALFASGNGAIAFDGDTVLCRVDGEYYLVKGTTVENAVAFVTQELLTE